MTASKSAGLIAEVHPDDALLDKALELAKTIATKPPVAVRLAKEAVLAARDLPLEAALAFERKAFAALIATEDFREGVKAFLEKRPASFSGR